MMGATLPMVTTPAILASFNLQPTELLVHTLYQVGPSKDEARINLREGLCIHVTMCDGAHT